MKRKFSKSWRSSKQPRKQRKYVANAPLHLKRRLLSVNLSKDLRKKHGRRNIEVRKGDVVKIMKGKFKKKQGRVLEVKTKRQKIYIEGMQVKKMEGSKVNVPFRAPNLQIIELNLDDKKRIKKTIAKQDIREEIPNTTKSKEKIVEKKQNAS